jgi:hypothetical protein
MPDIKKSSFEKYTDPTGEFTNQSLKFAEWYISHKLKLRKMLVIFLTVWSVTTLGFSLFMWGNYLIFGYQHDERMISNIGTSYISPEVIDSFKPADLQISGVQIFQSAKDKYDFVSPVVNSNEAWIARVSYKFTYGTGETAVEEATILPTSESFISFLGESVMNNPSSAELVVTEMNWERIDPHVNPYPTAFTKDRIQFQTSNLVFTPANQEEGGFSHSITFDISNNSLYSYWDPDFFLVYYDQDRVAGVTTFVVDRFKAGETRTIELKSLTEQLYVTDIKLIPKVNVFDENVYMPIGSS